MAHKYLSQPVLAAVAAFMVPCAAEAGTASAQFSLRLVVEPACPGDAARAVATPGAALALASSHLQAPPATLSADHDVRDTGHWLVSDETGPVLRIEKCSGSVNPPAETQNARSRSEPGASQAS